MKFKIHYEVNGNPDELIITGESVEEIRGKAVVELGRRHIDQGSQWSEQMKDTIDMTTDKIRELISRPGGYRLSEGVTATQEELVFDIKNDHIASLQYIFTGTPHKIGTRVYVGWVTGKVAERLWCREGEPWCRDHQYKENAIVCEPSTEDATLFDGGAVLTRIAAILCDDAYAFRVLHWCVHNLV